jgi:phenylalanyl-tRNA synthetase beta chain
MPASASRCRAPLVGAELPPGEDGKPFLIKLGKLRGVESQGMLCSARELQLSDDHGGLLELAADAPLGTNVRDVLKLDDTVFTLKLTPNLAHALSVYGVAREVVRADGLAVAAAAVQAGTGNTHDAKLAGKNQRCRLVRPLLRAAWCATSIPKRTTPQWMVDRLARCGQRSVTALVDISNYVMFELGRPSHIFDLDKIHGGLDVRWGRPGEQLKLLNGSTVTVDEAVGVIADDAAGRVTGRHHGRRFHRRV